MTPKFHALTVSDVRRETEDTVSIAFDVPQSLKEHYQYSAGQYVTLKTDIDGEEVRRSYSLCAAPHEDELRVAVKLVEGGRFSTYANTKIKKGDTLDVMTPMGNFTTTIEASNKKSYVFYAAGSGITPVIALVKEILHKEPQSYVTLFYGNRGFTSIIFREQLEGLKNTYTDRFRLIHVLSRENMGIPISFGRIDAEKCQHLFRTFGDIEEADAFFICGPEPMINEVRSALKEKGIAENKVHFELFTSPVGQLGTQRKKEVEAAHKAGDGEKSTVKVFLDDIQYSFKVHPKEESILEIAHQQGTDLPFACKGGVCCTCKAKLLEGEVTMDANYALEPDQVDAGYILTCQSHPKTKEVTISFDE